MSTIEIVESAFSGMFALKPKRPNIYQVMAPFFHEDGDIVEIFVEPNPDKGKSFRFCDYGLTLMHLSYEVPFSEGKEKVYKRILSENGLDEEDGNIFLSSDASDLLSNFLHYAQTIAKITSLEYFKKKEIKNLFYETVLEYIGSNFSDMPHQLAYKPLPLHKECIVDVVFHFPNKRPLYLFVVKESDNPKALEVAANCFEFKNEELKFLSVVVYQNFDSITTKHQNRLLRATDKPFLDLEQFQKESRAYIQNVA